MAFTVVLAFIGYSLWLLAGAADYACHRRARLAETSGLSEWLLHAGQVALLISAIVLWLALAASLALFTALVLLVLAHGALGYADTIVASRRRPIAPLEQHLHSILDTAPAVACVWILAIQWDQAIVRGWSWERQDPQTPAWLWIAVVAPGIALVGLPLLRELRQIILARRSRHNSS